MAFYLRATGRTGDCHVALDAQRLSEELCRLHPACIHGAALDALYLQQIARFKRPKHYRFRRRPAEEQNNYGKVLKTALREMLAKEDE